MGNSPLGIVIGSSIAAAAWLGGALSGCGPEPVGVDDCRAIESARCEAAVSCGLVNDADECTRFYRDHCLHGLAAPETPGGAAVTDCVEAIQRAGQCAEDDAEQSIADCLDGDQQITPLKGADLDNVCDVVRTPEQTRQCAFLSETADGEGGAAGDSGD
jgi:hypothetical protein